MEIKLTIQERLRDLRAERGLTLEQLANDTHISRSSLSSYESNECEGLVRMFLRFRFCGIVCCVLYRFSFPQSDL